jgi:hypothetical protein
MGIELAIAGIGLALTAASTVKGLQASKKQGKAQDAALVAQQQAEDSRRKSMDLDAARRRREVVRQAQVARATALSNATAQGAGSGSGLQGGFGAVSGQAGVNTLGITQNQELGGAIFDANARQNAAHRAGAAAGTSASTAAGLSSLGGAITKNAGSIARVGGFGSN